ncbi:MAG: hypothetical protein WC454_07345 [Phycisphaerae bacterium]|jgi:hypothetical protein
MKCKRVNTNRRGSALFAVLLIVMAITILSLGFLSRSDVELACGENMILRTQMDCLAESGLEHARGLILNPQDVTSEYWTGETGQQLVEGSDDYYDVSVAKLSDCNYQITCNAYREKNGERIGRSSLEAELRLDHCIALRTGSSWYTEPGTTVNGDVYTKGTLLTGTGYINGDAFATGTIGAANVQGQKYPGISDSDAPVSFPGLAISYFTPQYHIGSDSYSPDVITATDINNVVLGTDGENPAGVYYRNGDLRLSGNAVVNGTLVVTGELEIKGSGNSITAMKNFPALVVGDKLQMHDNAQLTITGLAQIKDKVERTGSTMGASLSVVGALFIRDYDIDGFESSASNIINVTAAPDKAAVEIWSSTGTVLKRWSPAGGAFFKSIKR